MCFCTLLRQFTTAAVALLLSLSLSPIALGAETTHFDLPAQPLDQAVKTVASQTGIVIEGDSALLRGKQAPALRGEFTPEQALERVLAESGLGYERVADGAIIIQQVDSGPTPEVAEINSIQVFGTPPARYDASTASTAVGLDVSLLDTPRSVQVITEQIILDQQAQDLRDVLRNASGIQPRNETGGTTDSFVMRGFEVKNVLQDGLQLGRNSQRMQTTNIERVEVIKGSAAILTGQSQPGGVINVLTKKPKALSRHVITADFDEHGRKEVMLDTTGAAHRDGNLLYRLVASVQDSETFRETDEPAEESGKLISPTVTWLINDSSSLTAGLEYTDFDMPIDEGTVALPNADGELALADIDVSTRLGEHDDLSESEQTTIYVHYAGALSDRWSLDMNLNHSQNQTDSFRNGPGGISEDGILTRSQSRFKPEEEQLFARVQLAGELAFAGLAHQLVAGMDYNTRDFKTEGFFDGGTPNTLDIFNPVYGQVGVNVVSALTNQFDDTQTSLYLNDLISIGEQWKVGVGFRLDRYERDGELVFSGNPRDISLKAKTKFSPNVGVVYKATPHLSVFASYSESFDPNFAQTNQLTGNTVTPDPTEGAQKEIGIKGAFMNDKLNFNLAYFDIEQTNILSGTDADSGEPLVNGKEHAKGVELDTNIQFSEGLSMIVNYAYLDEATVKSGNRAGNDIRNTPTNSANLWLTYEFTDGRFRGLGLGGGLNHVGDRFVDANNTFELEGHTTYDATAFYYLPVGNGSQLRFQIGINNLTDEEHYIPNSNARAIGVGDPRTVYASIGYEF